MVIITNDEEKGPPQSANHVQREWEIRRNEYHDKVVQPMLQHRPWLEILQRFMDPNAKGFAVDLRRRMQHFDIKVVHISTSGELSAVIDCSTLDEFHNAVTDDEDHSGTFVFAKDLSGAVIDALGTRYELEPEFFASHLVGTELYGMGFREPPASRAPARAPNLLPDYIRKAPFYTVEFRRPYHIGGGADKVFKMRGSVTNLPRGAHFLKEDLPDALVAEKISVYRKEGSNVGIILTDQLLSQNPPASYILTPVSSLPKAPPAPTTDTHTHTPRQHSSRHDLLTWLHDLPASDAKALFTTAHAPLALHPVLKIIERQMVMFLAHARFMMTRVLSRHCDASFPDSIPFFLHVSRSLHTHIHEQQKLLRYALRVVALRGGDDLAAQKVDFGFLAADLDAALKAVEEDVRFLVAAASIREGRTVGWVSRFAALFLPVSLLATILAISDPGYTRWAILGGLSVPFVLVSVYFMFFWKPAYLDSLRFE